MLVLTAPLALTTEEEEEEEIVFTVKTNLIFIDIEKANIEFVVYDADLLI